MADEIQEGFTDGVEISDAMISTMTDTQYGVIPYRVVIRDPIIIKDIEIKEVEA